MSCVQGGFPCQVYLHPLTLSLRHTGSNGAQTPQTLMGLMGGTGGKEIYSPGSLSASLYLAPAKPTPRPHNQVNMLPPQPH